MSFKQINSTILWASLILVAIFIFGTPTNAQTEFTKDELAKYNGLNGAPAYAAVDGVVYDLTNVPEWSGGRHFCANAFAGKDLTFLWNLVPRSHKNPNFLKRFPVVGRLVTEKSQSPSPSTTQPKPTIPTTKAPKEPNIFIPVIAGLLVAILITGVWLILRLRKK